MAPKSGKGKKTKEDKSDESVDTVKDLSLKSTEISDKSDLEKEGKEAQANGRQDVQNQDDKHPKDGKDQKLEPRRGEDKDSEVGVSRKKESSDEIPDHSTKHDSEKDVSGKDKSSSFQLIIDSILENLKIVIAGSQTLSLNALTELTNIGQAVAELPREINKVDPEISLVEDAHGEWCIQQGKIRMSKASWDDYESFLKVYRHIVEGGVKELYGIYRVNDDDYVNGVRIVAPEAVGFQKDPRKFINIDARNVIYDNTGIFQIVSDGPHCDSIPRAINPALAELLIETQNWLLDNDQRIATLREWICAFIRKKDQYLVYGMKTIWGRNNVKWYRVPHPRNVGI